MTPDEAKIYESQFKRGLMMMIEGDFQNAYDCFQQILQDRPDFREGKIILDLLKEPIDDPKHPYNITLRSRSYSKALLLQNLHEFLDYTMVRIKFMVQTFMLFSSFLILEQGVYMIFEFMVRDLRDQIEVVNWILDGFQVLTVGILAFYFLYSTIRGLNTQRIWAEPEEEDLQ